MSQESEYLDNAMRFVDLFQQCCRSCSRNHQRSQELEAVEEQAFQGADTVQLQDEPVEQLVEHSEESVDLSVDMLVLLVYQVLDKDHLHRRIHKCNLQEHLDQSKSFHRSCARYLVLVEDLQIL